MDKDFIPYEQALALKELGFDEPCFNAYDEYGKFIYKNKFIKIWNSRIIKINNINPTIKICSLPLYQQVFRWFRDNYQLEHKILRDSYGCRYQITKVTSTSLEDIDCKGQYSNTSYEEAELSCLKKLIEIVKTT